MCVPHHARARCRARPADDGERQPSLFDTPFTMSVTTGGHHDGHLRRRPRRHRARARRPGHAPGTTSRGPATSSRSAPIPAACSGARATPRRRSTCARLAGCQPAGVLMRDPERRRLDGARGRPRGPRRALRPQAHHHRRPDRLPPAPRVARGTRGGSGLADALRRLPPHRLRGTPRAATCTSRSPRARGRTIRPRPRARARPLLVRDRRHLRLGAVRLRRPARHRPARRGGRGTRRACST